MKAQNPEGHNAEGWHDYAKMVKINNVNKRTEMKDGGDGIGDDDDPKGSGTLQR